jgi:hypothetical protein
MFLGYLAKSDGSTSLVWERNEEQGAWASEGRIHILTTNFPQLWRVSLTAGNGSNVIHRINCNEFVENICLQHAFVCGRTQNIDNIRTTIPSEYLDDFDSGLNL